MTNRSYNINDNKKVITITKGFLKNAANPTSEEAQAMVYWKQVFPHYRIEVREVSPDKQSHKRLTEPFMIRFIKTRTDCESLMIEFNAISEQNQIETRTQEELNNMTKSQVKEFHKKQNADRLNRFTQLKKWFLKKFHDYSDSLAFAEYISKNAA